MRDERGEMRMRRSVMADWTMTKEEKHCGRLGYGDDGVARDGIVKWA